MKKSKEQQQQAGVRKTFYENYVPIKKNTDSINNNGVNVFLLHTALSPRLIGSVSFKSRAGGAHQQPRVSPWKPGSPSSVGPKYHSQLSSDLEKLLTFPTTG